MQVTRLDIEALAVLEPRVLADERGMFFDSFNEASFRGATEFTGRFVQDNHSISNKGVLRGLHYQVEPYAQGKLVRVVAGAAFDVAVDIRAGSPTFGKWAGVELNAANRNQFWIPVGFANGFPALEDRTEFLHKTSDLWHLQANAISAGTIPRLEWSGLGTMRRHCRRRRPPHVSSLTKRVQRSWPRRSENSNI
jgi:dTDP-4-dehydrorhamnose 3,5-epimerase